MIILQSDVLEIPPVVSAETAVRVQIAKNVKKEKELWMQNYRVLFYLFSHPSLLRASFMLE